MSLVLRNKGKGMQRSSEQPLVGEERYVTTLITAAKETIDLQALDCKWSLISAKDRRVSKIHAHTRDSANT